VCTPRDPEVVEVAEDMRARDFAIVKFPLLQSIRNRRVERR
jgi:hypothetical protein